MLPNDNINKILDVIEQGKSVNIELTEEEKTFLLGKVKEYEAEAEYYETYEPNEVEAKKLYDFADKLLKILQELNP